MYSSISSAFVSDGPVLAPLLILVQFTFILGAMVSSFGSVR